MEKKDVIIIGWWLGWLIAWAKLAKDGMKVVLIEQHNIPWDCATTFKRKGITCEVGLHEMDGFYKNDMKSVIFKDLWVFEHIKFVKVPEFYRLVNDKIDIVIPANIKKTIEILIKKFPEEKIWIKKFFKKIHSIHSNISNLPQAKWLYIIILPLFPIVFPHIIFNISKNLWDYLDSIIQNDDLKMVLLANLLYYHDDPYSMSLLYYSVAQYGFFKWWWYYIKGGSQKLSNYLAKVIIDNGWKILLWNRVTKILTEKDKVVWVEYKKVSSNNLEMKQILSKVVVANVPIPIVVDLLPYNSRWLLNEKIKNLEKSCSILCVYICFKKEVKDLWNKYYSTFIWDKSVKKQSDLLKNFKWNFERKNFVFVDYSQIDSGLAPKWKSFGVISSSDYISDWDYLSKEEYINKKEQVAQIFFKRLEKIIPWITDEIEYYEVWTSKTIERYTSNPWWSIYGYAQTPKQSAVYRIPNKSDIKNLYFASARSNPWWWFTGAILSGWFCSKEVLEKF